MCKRMTDSLEKLWGQINQIRRKKHMGNIKTRERSLGDGLGMNRKFERGLMDGCLMRCHERGEFVTNRMDY